MLTTAEKRAYNKLTNHWQSARTLHERLSTLDALVSMGLARQHYNHDSHFAENVRTKYRLQEEPVLLCANDITGILASSFPEWTWKVQQCSLVFTVIAKTIVKQVAVSYVLDVECAKLQSTCEVKQAGREAVAGLKEALRRHEKEQKKP